jgi:hypothetical protein
MARDYRSKMQRVKPLAALLFMIPLGASATIYQWTDEQGHVVFGNQVPESGVKNVRAVMKEDAPTNSNRELEERIARLERQLQAAQMAPAAVPYAAPLPPNYSPIPANYYPAPAYAPAMYPPPYYPFGYAYGLTVVRPVGFAPRFASRPFFSRPFASFHSGSFHRR